MRRIALVIVLVSCFTGATLLAADKPTTIKGEVVDTMCYAAMGSHGPSHTKCGIACAEKGIPVGLVEGNKMYILLPAKDGESLPASVIQKMGKTAEVTGQSYTSGGVSFLTVESVK